MLEVNFKKQLPHFDIDVEFSVENEIIALFGASGSGKTTILNGLAGLSKFDSGMIKLKERTLFKGKNIHIPVQKRKIGYLFQDYALFPHLTVWKNIIYGAHSNQFAKELMAELKIDHLIDKYPQEISGGEKQRVALVRALATKPDLLLLDEPFSALDEETRKRAHNELLRIQKMWSIPIILVTHQHDEAVKLSQRIYYLDKGKITDVKIFEKVAVNPY